MNKAAKNYKKTIQNPYSRKKKKFFYKNILLYTENNRSAVVKILVCNLSYSLKIMSRNTLPEPDSAS